MTSDGTLRLIRVLNAGIANRECIALRVENPTNLSSYGVMIAYANDHGGLTPYNDSFFWLGSIAVEAGDWIFLYTGSGQPTVRRSDDDLSSTHTLFWGKGVTQFANNRVLPIVFSFSSLIFEAPPNDQIQKALPQMSG